MQGLWTSVLKRSTFLCSVTARSTFIDQLKLSVILWICWQTHLHFYCSSSQNTYHISVKVLVVFSLHFTVCSFCFHFVNFYRTWIPENLIKCATNDGSYEKLVRVHSQFGKFWHQLHCVITTFIFSCRANVFAVVLCRFMDYFDVICGIFKV